MPRALAALLPMLLLAPILVTAPPAAATCTPTSSPAYALGPAYVVPIAGVAINPFGFNRYADESLGAIVWQESNGIPGLQSSYSQTCGAPVDFVLVGASERASAHPSMVWAGAQACAAAVGIAYCAG